ncbi:DNA polymerase III subunit delta [Sediminibacterium ginsengisoli]|uniref:DNA polymerase III subunit delta n=1 Tax=Sediminibacterium ginsengisoli TaxID=413434 RepID=A0A1T4QP76_9BACT|nr:DNA polymerase III subunit delta [Sediminibacterium ginsengisoli]SKA05559.1 DNA polymerase III, delta subunit [Sediminibacterium ginsengisoli]
MSAEKIIGEWKKGTFKPVYWLEGEEPFFIDQVMHYAEHKILAESEAGFNLTIFYGKDAAWTDVVNACRRYPMFSERQVVLLKEAQQMRDIDKLEGYIENPLPSTVFVVSYKDKKVDGRSKLSKLLKQKGEMLTTKKMYDSQLPEWANQMVLHHGLGITQKALLLLVDHIGNDLSRIQNEIEKLAVNLGPRKNITEDDIENYIGVSKEFNVFELQDAAAKKDMAKAIRIIGYFEANPKAAPIQLVLPALYNFFSKVFMLFSMQGQDEKTIASALGVNPYFMKDYLAAAKRYDYRGVENILLLLHQYNLRSIGIHDSGTSDASLMKELIVKMMA